MREQLTFRHSSLSEQVSLKISNWILILITTVIVAISCVAFFLSAQLFNKQVNTWHAVIPEQTMTNLIDSDYFSIKREVDFLNSTGLFSSIGITDNKKEVIEKFGETQSKNMTYYPIRDSANVVWGYFYLTPDFFHFILPFFIAAILFFGVVLCIYFFIRWRLRVSLSDEFSKFHKFLNEIEKMTTQLPEIYNQGDYEFNISTSPHSEEIVINNAIHQLIEEIKKSNRHLKDVVSANEQKKFQEELTKTALQVAHDIASPIAVLEVIESTISNIPDESKAIIRSAISQIRGISSTLLSKARNEFNSGMASKQMLCLLVTQIVSEKQLQYKEKINIHVSMPQDAYLLFAKINPLDFCRVLSNLINNAIDAIQDDNRIALTIESANEKIFIIIKDYGKGIAEERLQHLGRLGQSFEKSNGTGIGLNHAFNIIKEWGGEIRITSELEKGTSVILQIPLCLPPVWFVSEIMLQHNQIVAIIDDNQSIHGIWEMKLLKFQQRENISLEVLHFCSPEELLVWNREFAREKTILYVCDYEFTNSSMNGLEIIEGLGIADQSILLTSNITKEVMDQCEKNKIKLISKSVFDLIPIIVEVEKNEFI